MAHTSALWLALLAASSARAHFPFIVPEDGTTKAKVILSEHLRSDSTEDISLLNGTKLSMRDVSGKDMPLMVTKADQGYEVLLPGAGTRVVYGVTDLGGMRGGNASPSMLLCHLKAIVGDPFDSRTVIGDSVPVELLAVGRPGATRLKLLVHGKPVTDAEITVIPPEGSRAKRVKTDGNGETEAFPQMGRFGAWARVLERDSAGRQGQAHDGLRQFATIVFEVGVRASKLAALPHASSSFGAVQADGWLYVYGGHVAPTPAHFDEAVSGAFHRMRVDSPGNWEQLAAGPRLQGLNLAEYRGKIYRIGGMAPRNRKGAPEDNYSTADCARFDPSTGVWEPLPPLPEPRSSHDVVVLGDELFVFGGWTLAGNEQRWAETVAILDLNAKKLEWKSTPQTFRRRSLVAAALHGKVYVAGGFDDKGQIARDVLIFDPKTRAWTQGVPLPKGTGFSFAPAGVAFEDRLYVSLSDGALLRLDEERRIWEKIGTATSRVAHRLGSFPGKILVIGGTAGGKKIDSIEAIPVAQ